jgi:hypothetical protein
VAPGSRAAVSSRQVKMLSGSTSADSGPPHMTARRRTIVSNCDRNIRCRQTAQMNVRREAIVHGTQVLSEFCASHNWREKQGIIRRPTGVRHSAAAGVRVTYRTAPDSYMMPPDFR